MMSHLIAEDFDLTVTPVRRWRVVVRMRWRLLVRVDLYVQGQALNALLTGEVRAQALHGHVYL